MKERINEIVVAYFNIVKNAKERKGAKKHRASAVSLIFTIFLGRRDFFSLLLNCILKQCIESQLFWLKS